MFYFAEGADSTRKVCAGYQKNDGDAPITKVRMVYVAPNTPPTALLVPEGFVRSQHPTNLKEETRGKVFLAWTTGASKKSGGVRKPLIEANSDRFSSTTASAKV